MADNTDDTGNQRGERPAGTVTTRDGGRRSLDALLAGAELREASDVLILGELRRSLDDQVCGSFLRHAPLGERNVLFISLTRPAEDRLRVLRERGGSQPPAVSVVSGTDQFEAATTETTTADVEGNRVTVDAIDDPSDLPKLGMTISRAVKEWDDTGVGTVVCFHSLTALLQYADRGRVFRFLHVLQDRMEAVDAVTHYHMDAEAHDDQTIATLRPLFDAVVEIGPGGDATISG
jgi:hypothetical protein